MHSLLRTDGELSEKYILKIDFDAAFTKEG
jgi:replication initiation and membrane attachment protein DnaB